MIVVGWNNGLPNNKTGVGYGIRIARGDRDKYFQKVWPSVTIELDNGYLVDVKLSDSFWGRCTELRSAKIGKWTIDRKLAPWPKQNPPKLRLEPIKGRKFRLSCS